MKLETNNYQSQNNLAFTLVEMSIVIVIIGLLVAGILSGQKLVQNSKLQNVIKEIREYDVAIRSFKDKFRYYPGDLPTATTYWGAYAAGPPITGTNNGNGDWQISSTTTESLYLWRQLYLAGYVPSVYTGTTSSPNSWAIGANTPGSKYDSMATYFVLYHTNNFQTSGNALTLARMLSTDAWGGEILTSTGMYFIDTKIDDGNAGTGNLYGIDGSTASAGACSGGWMGAPANYNLATTKVACRLFWWLDKNK